MRLLALFGVLALAACGPSTVCRDPMKAPSYANDIKQQIAVPTCENCHSPTKKGADRNGAPEDQNFDTYAKMKGTDNGALAAQRVSRGEMPPKNLGVPDLTAAQKDTFLQWVYCGANP